MNIDFSFKTVLVTGASGGIGREVAIMFSRCGARVIVHYNTRKEEADKTLSLLSPGEHFCARADLSDSMQVEAFSEMVTAAAGHIDFLVNNAGLHEELDIMSCTYAQWLTSMEKTFALNLMGAANLSFCIGRRMAAADGGKIINISSRGAFRGEPGAPSYGASKAGLNAMGQSLAKAFAAAGVFVYTVAPGFVETDMASGVLNSERGDEIRSQSPLGRVAKPEEVARAVVLLASDGTEFMTGCILDVNGASYLRT
ncbi:MAG: SDR family oxidoreductase [Bacteroidota bacterium]